MYENNTPIKILRAFIFRVVVLRVPHVWVQFLYAPRICLYEGV